jgi:hypothetical protein
VVNKYSIQHRSPSTNEVQEVGQGLHEKLAAKMNQFNSGVEKVKHLTALQSNNQVIKMKGKVMNHS